MGTKLFLSVLICLGIISCSLGYPRTSNSDSDEDDSQQQQQQNLDSGSLEEFTQKIQFIKGRRKPEKVQVPEEPEPYDPCLDTKKIGPCKAHIPRYFFNKASGTCQVFPWGGCAKNGNNFKELSDCETTCSKHISKSELEQQQNTSHSSMREICEKPPVNDGPQCAAYISRWTYNSTQNQCVQFYWGGCSRTENNFATETACKEKCGGYSNFDKLRGYDIVLTTPRPTNNNVGPEVCDLPTDPGNCFALFERYAFNKLHNRCELFHYGGCGGNRNNFNTAEDCQRICGGDSPSKDYGCMDVECPWAHYDQYVSLGCSPIYDGDACCPTRYECSDQQRGEPQNNTLDSRSLTLEREDVEETSTLSPEVRKPQKCRYRGKMYNVGEMVEEASDTGSCRAGCMCTDFNGEYGPKIICAQIECPEELQGRPRGKENCIPLYKRGACCAHDYYCPEGELTVIDPTQNQQTDGNKPPLAKCNVDGEAVYEGQRHYPDKSPCSKCLCERNPANATSLDGQLNCEKIDCGIEIYYSHYLAQGCAPVYYEKGDGTTSCCPITWECPDNKEQESESEDISDTTPETADPAVNPPKPPSTDTPLSPSPPSPRGTDDDNDPPIPSSSLVRSPEACTMEKVEGDCKGHRSRFYFNEATKKCESFVYTGCKGNLNNFASIDDCKNLCEANPPSKGGKTMGGLLGRTRAIDTSPRIQQQGQEDKAISLTEVDPCTLPKRVGRCKGYFPRFYYSPEDNECKLFIFGGCRPNANNFYSKDACEATCLNKIPVENLRTNVPTEVALQRRMGSESSGDSSRVNFGEERRSLQILTPTISEDDICVLPPRTGRCKAFVPRFYYDTEKKMCKQFTYGGCAGNANNFQSLEDCNTRCGMNENENVALRTIPGSRGQAWRIASNDNVTGASRESSHGSGGQNSLPPSTGFTARCKLPSAPGSCHASIRSYYYDVETKSCRLFFYSGCFGNANRFITQKDCEDVCKKPLESEGAYTTNDETTNSPNRHVVHELSEPTERTTDSESQEKDFCMEDPAPGNCTEKQLRFFYDSVAEECLPFVFSGCRGNRNNFFTEAECMSSCGNKPTLEQLADGMVLSCTFGNKTIPLGGIVGKNQTDYNGDEPPCGVPVCQCITPPAVTCIHRLCPEPTTTSERPFSPCPHPTCRMDCRRTTGQNGCPTCDCSPIDKPDQSETKQVPVKSVKG